MAVYSRLKPARNPLKPGEWNQLDVTFIGRWLTVVLNGEAVRCLAFGNGLNEKETPLRVISSCMP